MRNVKMNISLFLENQKLLHYEAIIRHGQLINYIYIFISVFKINFLQYQPL